MSRRPLPLAAAVFLVLLVATAFLLRRPAAPPETPFFTLAKRIPDTLSVAYGPDTTVVVAGGRTGWEVIRPVRDAADDIVVSAVLKRLAPLPVEDRIFPLTQEKMDTYGMRHPRVIIRAAYRGDTPPDTLEVGAFTLNGNYDYVRRGTSRTVGLLDARVTRGYLSLSTPEIRFSILLPFEETRADTLELLDAAGRSRIAVVRRPDASWWVERPYPGPADAHRTVEYLQGLNHMHIERFVREKAGPLAPYGLAHPRAGVRVVTSRGDTLLAQVGDPLPGSEGLVYAVTRDRPQLLGVSGKYVPVLETGDDLFRERSPFPFGLASVDSVVIRAGGRSRTLALSDTARRPSREIRDVLGNWVGLAADRFAEAGPESLARAGLVGPVGSLVWYGKGDTLAVEEVGPARGDHRAIRLPGGRFARRPEILYVPERRAGPLWGYLAGLAAPGGSP